MHRRRPSSTWLGAGLAVSLVLGPVALAHADGAAAPRAFANVGVGVPVLSHTLYDAGVVVTAGAEVGLGRADRDRLRVRGRWIGLATTGARADLGMVEAAWRVAPAWSWGLRFEVGAGLLLEVERLRLNLPARGVADANTRVGAPASVAIGRGLGRWAEIEVGYQQLLFFHDLPRTAGIVHAAIGGRL